MIRFIYSRMAAASKPQGNAIKPYQYPANYIHEECDIDRIASLIGEGRAWRASIYDEDTPSFTQAHARQTQIIALDFDACPHTPDEITQYAVSIGLPPSLWYYSYSQGTKPANNFRVLWVLAEPITPTQYKNIYPILLDIFKDFNPDKATKDTARLWYGTTHPPHIISTTPVSLGSLGWLGVMEKMKAGKSAAKAKGHKVCGTDYFDMAKPEAMTVGKGWHEQLRVRCWLWDKWEKGEYLDYNQRLTLFVNLRYLRYGDTSQSVLRDTLSFYNEDTYSGHTCNEDQIRSIFRSNSLVPVPIVLTANGDYITVPDFFKDQKEKFSFVNTERIPLAELDRLLDEQMPVLLSSDDIIYIEAQTSAGKSERVIQWLLTQDLAQKKIIYSVPKHSNGKEFYERMAIHQTMENVRLIPKGNYTSEDLLRMEVGLSARTPQDERFSMIREMVRPQSKGLFIITHNLLAHTEELYADCIVIDENIEEALVDTVRCGTADMYALLDFMPHREDRDALCAFIEEVKVLKRNQPIDITPLRDPLLTDHFDWEAYAKSNVRKIVGLGRIRYMDTTPKTSVYEGSPSVRFVARSKLYDIAIRKQIPVKMMSATPRVARLKSLYNTDIQIHTFPLAENAGKVIQYLGMTGAKGNQCDKVPDLIAYVKKKLAPEEIKNSWVISYMGAADMWRREGFRVPELDGDPIHLQNNSGLDFLKGENVIVAGKPDMNDEYYTDLYYDMYPDATEDPVKKTCLEIINGKTVRMFLWADEALRNIQLENIRLAAEQACGRARSLREENANVYLFLNYPVRDADEYRD